jgi:hypothetical protein
MQQSTAKLIEAARDVLRRAGYYVDNLWHVDDIHFICEQENLPKISDEEAAEVFMIAKEQFDGETGLTWPNLQKALRTYLQRRQVLSHFYESELNKMSA